MEEMKVLADVFLGVACSALPYSDPVDGKRRQVQRHTTHKTHTLALYRHILEGNY